MRRLLLPATAAIAIAATPAAAQDADAPRLTELPLADMAGELRDPDRQRETAMLVQTMAEILLDLPIAPLAQAAAEMAGEKAEAIDPNLTLRKVAPDAGRVSEGLAVAVPRAMEAMGAMSEGAERMKPALRDMAERLRDLLPRD